MQVHRGHKSILLITWVPNGVTFSYAEFYDPRFVYGLGEQEEYLLNIQKQFPYYSINVSSVLTVGAIFWANVTTCSQHDHSRTPGTPHQ